MDQTLGWIYPAPGDYSITGGSGSFDASTYIFAPYAQKFTTYGSGFQTGNTTDYDNIWYDNYSGTIDQYKQDFSDFWGVESNIQENQSVNTTGFLAMARNDTARVQLECWKVVNNVRIDVWKLTDFAVQEILANDKLKDANFDSEGIRFSSVLATQTDYWASGYPDYRGYMDTAWKFFGGTSGTGWSICERGFQYSNSASTLNANYIGNYKQGASAANEFDNILILPVIPKKLKREIYIRHVDESGNVIAGLQNSYIRLESPPGPDKLNLGATSGYQEHYTITGDEKVIIRKSDVTTVGGITYTFEKGISSSGATIAAAQTWPGKHIWSSPTTEVITNTLKVDDVLVIDLVYSKPPVVVPQALPKFEIIGKLCFINTNSPYATSTNGNLIDYIPSTKTETPYAEGAYPYTVRALRYDTKFDDLSSSATITVNVTWSWDTHAQVCPSCTGKDCKPPPCYCTTTGHTGSDTKSFTYTVPYKHTYYDITNFKMYRISQLQVYDDITNIGGILFSGGTYTINPSTSYNGKFTGANVGKIDDVLTVTFDNITYTIPNQAGVSPSGTPCAGSGESDALAKVAATYGKVDALKAADDKSLRIYYKYDNDFMRVDGMDTMLDRNYKSWDEHINLITNTKRDLDSTKVGPGSTNGATVNYTSNLMNFMKPPLDKRTTNADFTPDYKTVPVDKENGIRWLKGKIFYDVLTTSGYNIGGDGFVANDATYTTYPTYTLGSAKTVTASDFIPETKEYKGADVNKVNVFTPLRFGTFEVETPQIVDHTGGAGHTTVLQKNAEFTITPNMIASTQGGYNSVPTTEFVKGYYFTFNFDVEIDNDGNGTYESPLPAFVRTYRGGNATVLRARTTESFGSTAASQITNSVKVVAISTNIPPLLLARFNNATYSYYTYIDNDFNKASTSGVQNQVGLLTRSDIVSDSFHGVYKMLTTKNIGRIFDFAVTDCTDLAFEEVFRKPNTTKVNETTSVAYYSGLYKWNLYNQEAYNDMEPRPESEIGTGLPKKILPLGPYKNTNTKYVNAPKMGYRISYDLKTTGYIANRNATDTREIRITPNYYYISKDGKVFDNNITLYYKNSKSNYIKFVDTSINGYKIYFRPNDGYRYLRNGLVTDNIDMMSKKLEPLSVSGTIILNSKMMSINNTSFIQSWYGEYKLPNSTIAISNVAASPNNSVNNPYKDGYIGVRFDIRSVDKVTGGQTIIYDTNDKSAGTPNTSQWDYEKFMNFSSPGNLIDPANPIRYQLEKDMWVINDAGYPNSIYQFIKGTVVLFDIDNRAANDFE